MEHESKRPKIPSHPAPPKPRPNPALDNLKMNGNEGKGEIPPERASRQILCAGNDWLAAMGPWSSPIVVGLTQGCLAGMSYRC